MESKIGNPKWLRFPQRAGAAGQDDYLLDQGVWRAGKDLGLARLNFSQTARGVMEF
jgi:hypothetical protein